MTLRPFALPLVLLALAPAALQAQKPPIPVTDAPPPPEFGSPAELGTAGGSLVLALPTGEFKRYVNVGGGVNGFLDIGLGRHSPAGIRIDGTFILYGNERRRVPLSSTVQLVYVDVNTSNQIVNLGIGPRIAARSGAIRPWVGGEIGFSYFWTSSSVAGSDNAGPFASSTNFKDFTLAWRAGGGLLVQVGHGRTPIYLDLAAHYLRNGRVSYLRPGSIDTSVSPPVITPIESETNLWLVQLGVTAGLLSRR
jgi:hypothetical protein